MGGDKTTVPCDNQWGSRTIPASLKRELPAPQILRSPPSFSSLHPLHGLTTMNTARRRNLLFFSSALFLTIFFLFSSSLSHATSPTSNTVTLRTRNLRLHRRHLHEEIARSHCEGTLYPELCVSTVASFPGLASKSLRQVVAATINLTMGEVQAADSNCSSIEHSWVKRLGPLDRRALDDCLELFQETMDEFHDALSDLSGTTSASKHIHDLQTLLSGKFVSCPVDEFLRSDNHSFRSSWGSLISPDLSI